MPHAFDGQSCGQLVGDLARLILEARDHEQRLNDLVTRLEGNDQPDHLEDLRACCVESRNQRQRTEELLVRLKGDGAIASSPARPRILIVDDSEEMRDVVGEILEAAGFEVITAGDGLEGVLAAHYAQPSVVIMDLAMPVLDGFEAARLLKASSATGHLQIVAITANPDLHRESLKQLFAHVLRKPADPETVVAAVRKQLAADA